MNCCLKSVTVSREPSRKYYASLLCEDPDCEDQTAGKTYGDVKIPGIDYAMHGGAVKKELKLSERIYICPCGNRMDRDLNAAINIWEEARRMLCV